MLNVGLPSKDCTNVVGTVNVVGIIESRHFNSLTNCIPYAGSLGYRQLAPSTIRCASAAAEGTSVLVQHLTEELSELPISPAAKLRSRLLRWRSEDRGKERWKGVVDVLRAQSQVGTSPPLLLAISPISIVP